MKCPEAREAMLEVEPGVLTGGADHPVSAHLNTCPRCRSAAAVLLSDQAALADALVEVVPDPDLEKVLALGPVGGETEPGTRLRARLPIRALIPWATIPLAAAAAAVALLLPGETTLPGEAYVPPRVADGLEIETPEGTNVAVFETKNPEITVLWFF